MNKSIRIRVAGWDRPKPSPPTLPTRLRPPAPRGPRVRVEPPPQSQEPPLKRVKRDHIPARTVRTVSTVRTKMVPVRTKGGSLVFTKIIESEYAIVVEGEKEEAIEEEEEKRVKESGPLKYNITWKTCGIGGCKYRTKKAGHLKQHQANIHAIDIVWHGCSELGCEYQAKEKGSLKKHLALVHDIGVTWYTCPRHMCSHKTKEESSIERHIAAVHDVGVIWHACAELGCSHRAKLKGDLKKHVANIHDIGVNWHACKDCDYKSKQTGTLYRHIRSHHEPKEEGASKQHNAKVHEATEKEEKGVAKKEKGAAEKKKVVAEKKKGFAEKESGGGTWTTCGVGGCVYGTNYGSSLRTHKANIHNIGVKWKNCPDCDFKAKTTVNLNVHLEKMHNLDVQWKQCPQCDFKAKSTGGLNRHIKAHQDPALDDSVLGPAGQKRRGWPDP